MFTLPPRSRFSLIDVPAGRTDEGLMFAVSAAALSHLDRVPYS